jgi:peptidoglycan/LPS O-acetylase OafA/YrhL
MRSIRDSANLDLFRSFAVLLVFSDHLFATIYKSLDVGRLGVLFFFVHTSLVLMFSMERLNLSGASLFRVFYTRRAFRIYPLSLLTCAVMLFCRIPAIPWIAFHMPTRAAILSNLLLVQNLTITDPVVGPLWSLPVEVQMYLLLPLFFLFLKKTTTVRPVIWLFIISAAVGLLQIEISYRLNIFSYIPCFSGGILAYQRMKEPRIALAAGLWPMSIVALTVVFLALPGSQVNPVKGWLICACAGFAIPNFRQISWQPVVTVSKLIARYSYGIYLSHLPIMWLVFRKLAGTVPAVGRWSLFVVLVIFVPVILYHCIEAPLIGAGAWLTKRSLGSTRRLGVTQLPELRSNGSMATTEY